MLRFVNMILVPQFRRCFWSLQPRGPGSLRCSSASWECAWIQRTTARRAAVLHSHNVSLPPAVAPEGENNTGVRRWDFKKDLDSPIQLHGKQHAENPSKYLRFGMGWTISLKMPENKTGPKEHSSVIMWLNAYFCPMLKLKLVEESPGVAQVWFNFYRS